MRTAKRFGVVAAALIVLAAMVPAFAADGVKVGEFVVKVAEAKQLPAANTATAERSLRDAGYDLPALDLNGALTERVVVQISRALGINVSTSSPDAVFTTTQVNDFFSVFGQDVGVVNNPGGDDNPQPRGDKPKVDPLTKGKGKKKGLKRTPQDPV